MTSGEFRVNSVEETWAVARELAKELRPGDVVCLEGDRGAGKTTFVQGLAAALANIVTTAILGTALCMAYAAAKPHDKHKTAIR